MNLFRAKLRPSVVLTVLIAVIALAGCGSSGGSGSKNTTSDFNAAYAPISAQIKALGPQIGTAITTARGKSNAALATEFGTLSTDFDAVKSKLAGLTPPSADKADFDALNSAMGNVSTDLHGIASAAQTGNVAAAKAATQKFVVDAAPLKAARAALNQKTGAGP
jgi:soluble cytochrome b562